MVKTPREWEGEGSSDPILGKWVFGSLFRETRETLHNNIKPYQAGISSRIFPIISYPNYVPEGHFPISYWFHILINPPLLNLFSNLMEISAV